MDSVIKGCRFTDDDPFRTVNTQRKTLVKIKSKRFVLKDVNENPLENNPADGANQSEDFIMFNKLGIANKSND